MEREWAGIVARSLTWEEAHVSLDSAVRGLPPELRGVRPAGYPHSVWELLVHIRVAQDDLLEFCVNADYSHDLKWPDDYWPPTPAPPDDAAWTGCLTGIRDGSAALARFATENAPSLADRIPHGTGQTYLRTVLVAADHAAYHVGQIVDVRRLLGAWPPPPDA